ncbi:kinase-like protein [Nadsonia fulvescens var. elongata DSM 6958]|uniref:Cyclin-dependent kinase 8 n=1 Tax=Nadsonia fulvescens var. elongata DSM 6958 TaxID=857566 RepID=A0A1E3PQA7_9ASCO|nr:kinase-like protein [Nadsonia fulvescens var. elongata DSM 6958]
MALCREINHRNLTKLVETILEEKCIYMVFEFAEHDLLQIIHFHSHPDRNSIPESTLKSIMWQLLNGVSYLHQNWILHRDLKPANIMVTADGIVKIGDLGLARVFSSPLQSLYSGDKVVVTIWYRAPELLLGGRHYTPAVDMWAVGCIFAELLALRPIFKGEEAKIENNTMSNNGAGSMAGAGGGGNNISKNGNNNNGNLAGTVKKSVPFQRHQLQKIVEILGTPSVDEWPSLNKYPEFMALQSNFKIYPKNLKAWYHSIGATNLKALSLLQALLEYDTSKRLTAMDALSHPYFTDNNPKVTQNVFENQDFKYPGRKIAKDDNDIKSGRKRTNNEMGTSQRKKQK